MEEQITRKDFFKALFGGLGPAVNARAPKNSGLSDYHFPPGAKSREAFLSDCSLCYDCISVCPHEALRVWRGDDSDLNGFPVIVPRRQPCLECPERPCVLACSTSALSSDHVAAKLFTARILPEKCLAYRGNFCQACITNCPHGGEAIAMDENARPVINEARCDGCGVCIHACPAEDGAIKLIYLESNLREA